MTLYRLRQTQHCRGSVTAVVVTLEKWKAKLNSATFDKLIAKKHGQGLPVPHCSFDDFLALTRDTNLSERLGDAHIVDSYADTSENHWNDLPDNLIPFLWVRQKNHVDYYCFDIDSPTDTNCSIAVFAVHATVRVWPNFESFLQWVKLQ